MSNVIERIERGEIPKHGVSSVVLTHKDCYELLRLARLGQERQWVSVADRLPEIMNVVDIIYRYDGKQYRATNVVYDKFEQFGMYKNVTHWMPMPKPPKEESND